MELRRPLLMKQNKARHICIVTPDIIGPVRNGGIGTHCYYLALEWARRADTKVSVLFTGPYEQGTKAEMVAWYQQYGIEYLDLDDTPACTFVRHGCEWFVDHALRIKEFLATREFSQVHFQDWKANGFACVQAKRTGRAFQKTLLTVTLHSSSQWVREGMKTWAQNPAQDVMLDYCERYVAAFADVVLSPSTYMLDWAESKGWKLTAQRQVIPYCFDQKVKHEAADSLRQVDLSHLIFFGRLETRKGLELFTAGLERVVRANPDHGIKKVTFLGKIGNTQFGYDAGVHLNSVQRFLGQHNIQVNVVTQLSSLDANRFLKETRGVVFICSLQDNYPFTVIECLENQVPFIAAKTGGIPELVHEAALFNPTLGEMALAITQRAKHLEACVSKYDGKKARESWNKLLDLGEVPTICEQKVAPKVSICVAYFNYGKYLPQLLRSLAESQYANFEVVAVDDGSTDTESVRVFEQMRLLYEARGWKFFSKENEGIGATRNYAASKASGDFVIFMDADNLAAPGMIEAFVAGMQTSQCDCLTCHFTAFNGDVEPETQLAPIYGYTPIGPCIEIGPIANVFGDANFCIKRSVFEALGGFGTDRTTSYEDYEFLARLALSGYALDVIPESLFFYRHLEGGFSRMTHIVANQQRVISTFIKQVNKLDAHRLFNVLLTPLSKQVERFTEEVRVLHAERAELQRQLTETRRLLSCYDRFGYRSTTKVLNFLDSLPALKYALRDFVRAVLRAGRWALRLGSRKNY